MIHDLAALAACPHAVKVLPLVLHPCQLNVVSSIVLPTIPHSVMGFWGLVSCAVKGSNVQWVCEHTVPWRPLGKAVLTR